MDHHPQTSVPLKIRIVNVYVLEWNCLEPGEDLLDILRPHHVDELREVRREEDDFEGVLAMSRHTPYTWLSSPSR